MFHVTGFWFLCIICCKILSTIMYYYPKTKLKCNKFHLIISPWKEKPISWFSNRVLKVNNFYNFPPPPPPPTIRIAFHFYIVTNSIARDVGCLLRNGEKDLRRLPGRTWSIISGAKLVANLVLEFSILVNHFPGSNRSRRAAGTQWPNRSTGE